jgi:hypothetical protein
MANSPRKSKDPTDLALSAIEDALNVSRDPAPSAPRETSPSERLAATRRAAATEPRRGRAPQVEAEDRSLTRGAALPDDALADRLAANENRESVGQLLRALQRRPSRKPVVVAWAFTVCWVIFFAGMALGTYATELGDIIGQGLTTALPLTIGLIAAFFAPIVLFFFLATMLSRAQELRLVGQSMAEIAVRLAEPESVARDSIVSVGQAVRREVAAIGDGVERALARASELEGMVNDEVAALERAYTDNETRMRGLIDGIANQRTTLVDHAEQVRLAISNVHVDLSNEIGAVSEMVAEQVNEAATRITESLSEKGEHITRALQDRADNMIVGLDNRSGDLLERLEQTSEMTTRAIDQASDRLMTSLTFKTNNINDEFAGIADNVQHMMASKLDQVADEFSQKAIAVVDGMDARSRSIGEALIENSSTLAETIAARVDEVNNTLKATGDSLVLDLSLRGGDVVSKLEQTGAAITEAITTGGTRVSDTFQHHAEALTTSVESHGDSMRDLLAQRLAAFEDMFSRGGSELAERISRDSTTLGDLITRHLTEFDHTVKTYGGEIVQRIGARTNEMHDAMRDYVDGFDTRVTAKVSDVSTLLDQRLTRFQDALDGRTQSLNETLSTRITDIARTVADGGKDVVAALDQRIDLIGSTINAQADVITARLMEQVRELDSNVDAQAAKVAANFDQHARKFDEQFRDFDRKAEAQAAHVASSFDARIKRFEQIVLDGADGVLSQIETRGHNAASQLSSVMQDVAAGASQAEQSIVTLSTSVNNSLRQTASEVERSLLGVSTQVSRTFTGKADEIVNTITARSNDLTRLLDEKNGTLVNAIGLKTIEISNELVRVTDAAANEIETKGQTFARSLRDNSQDIAQKINDASERAVGSVSKSMREMEASTANAVDNARKTAQATVAEILETNGMLRTDTTALFERLREANGLLQEVLGSAQTNLNTIENVLSTRVTDFVGAMNTLLDRTGQTTTRMDEHIGGFYEVTGRVLANLNDLSSGFDQHGRELAEIAGHLDSTNKTTEAAINSRRDMFEGLARTLDSRTEDLDGRLKRFSALLDESLASAEERARDIARTIADSATTGSRAVSEQFQVVREHAEDERTRTIQALRQVYEHATGDTQSMFDAAQTRFTEIVTGMKQMATDMQAELERTRAELRRGILELPQETAESAAQMRRVIVDQIEALAELNRIVARHGREMETSEPMARPRLVREEAVAMGGRTEVPQARFVGNAPPVQPSTRRPDNYAPRQQQAPQSQAPQGGQQGRDGNWLSDLLSRASTDGDAQPPRQDPRASRGQGGQGGQGGSGDDRPTRHSIESLDSLSVDIARMIDHEAAAELWDRYNRGERNVFTRKLYTMQGQRAFDEIRKRYRVDREFHQTVDRYIAEFERLLEEVSRDDRGHVVARTYLTSETGKVYTMLAHAAGRIE